MEFEFAKSPAYHTVAYADGPALQVLHHQNQQSVQFDMPSHNGQSYQGPLGQLDMLDSFLFEVSLP
jgi:hypothetical protein